MRCVALGEQLRCMHRASRSRMVGKERLIGPREARTRSVLTIALGLTLIVTTVAQGYVYQQPVDRLPLRAAGAEQRCERSASPGFQRDGGYAEYMLVPHPRHLVPLGHLHPDHAAPLADAGVTPWRAVQRASADSASSRCNTFV